LAKGELKSALTIEVAGASKAAVAAVEKLGGKVILPPAKPEKPASPAKSEKPAAKSDPKPEAKPASPQE
jgi:large subunit ribosomal protein L15